MFWNKQKENDYNEYVKYALDCRDLEYCKWALDSVSKKYRGGVFVHKSINPRDNTVKKIDYIIEVANNKKIRQDVETELRDGIRSMRVI